MLFQDAYGTVKEVKDEGCYITCFCNAFEIQRASGYLSQLDLNEYYYSALVTGAINKDCFVNSAVNFCANILHWTSVIAIKKILDPDYVPRENEIEILLMRRYDPGSSHADKEGFVYHFVLRRRSGQIIDPIQQGSLTAQIGYVHTKRIIVLNEVSKV